MIFKIYSAKNLVMLRIVALIFQEDRLFAQVGQNRTK
jgi:hypothetical protein